jgi:hypothetical protein
VDNRKGRAWPDRSVFQKHNQDLAAGAIALRRGVPEVILDKLLASRGGWPRWKEIYHNARDHHTAVPGLQEPELLHHEEQEDHYRPA